MFNTIKAILTGTKTSNAKGSERLKKFNQNEVNVLEPQKRLANSSIASNTRAKNRYETMCAKQAELKSLASVNYGWVK